MLIVSLLRMYNIATQLGDLAHAMYPWPHAIVLRLTSDLVPV